MVITRRIEQRYSSDFPAKVKKYFINTRLCVISETHSVITHAPFFSSPRTSARKSKRTSTTRRFLSSDIFTNGSSNRFLASQKGAVFRSNTCIPYGRAHAFKCTPRTSKAETMCNIMLFCDDERITV